ncbi:MAG TPA: hypothetical protein VHO69_19320 [Phototrophicaceae bacterium]|nr:hypothetical protein [Phototrophicaceae bacterium]
MTDPRHGGIAVLDFGSQYTQLIARRVREQGRPGKSFTISINGW